MKKISALVLAIFFLPTILAVSIEMKTDFAQGETLMAKVSGNFYESITKEDVSFYKGHVRQPMSPLVAKINNNFYIYAQLLEKEPNNYSILLENVKSFKLGQIVEENIEQNFTITNKIADFSINPGFVVAEGNFSIEVQNLLDSEIELNVDLSSIKLKEETPVKISAGSSKKIFFSTESIINSTFETMKLSTLNSEYEIPVFIFADKTESVEKEKTILKFEPPELGFSMATDSDKIKKIILKNSGEEPLKDISLSVSDSLKNYVLISPEEINKLDGNSEIEIELLFNSKEQRLISGALKVNSSFADDELEISVNFIKDFVPPENYNESILIVAKTCGELGGEICDSDETCDTDYVYTDENGVLSKCCVENCQKQSANSSGKIIGWSIVGIVIVFLIWFFKFRYKGTKGNLNLLDIAKGKK